MAKCSTGLARETLPVDWTSDGCRGDRRSDAVQSGSDFVAVSEVDVVGSRSIGMRRKGWNSAGYWWGVVRRSEGRILVWG